MDWEVTCERDPDLAALARDWRALETRAEEVSFFQSWTWVGCLAEERFTEAVAVRAVREGQLVGLALFNRSRRRLCLTEAGRDGLDAPFIEHNAPLVARGEGQGCVQAMLAAALRHRGVRRLVLSGTPETLTLPSGAVVLREQARGAPHVSLDAVRARGGDFLATLSANARYQIRRALRASPCTVERATTEEQALGWFDGMVALHQAAWQARGKPGAFATAFMLRFHRALIATALPRDEVDMLRLTTDGGAIGYLLNYRRDGWIHAYQSGLDLSAGGPHGKPGLVAHAMAIQRAVDAGDRDYDFLAGASRYKASLGNASRRLLWREIAPRLSVEGMLVPLLRGVTGRSG